MDGGTSEGTRSRQALALIEAGAAAADAYRTRRDWIHRCVETLTFPARDEIIIRRQLSFDLTIPVGLRVMAGSSSEHSAVYVPLFGIPKWPPLTGFDLRDGDGRALSLLMRRENDLIDTGLLRALGTGASNELLSGLERVVRSKRPEAAQDALVDALRRDTNGADRSAIDPALEKFARAFVTQSILWAPVVGVPGERKIVKFGYDIRLELAPLWFQPSSLGWACVTVAFGVPDSANAASYHLEVAIPAPVRVTGARLGLYARAPVQSVGQLKDRPFRPLDQAAKDELEELGVVELAADRHARFYVAAHHEKYAVAWIRVIVEKTGFIRGSFVASLTTSIVLLSLDNVAGLKHVVAHSTDSITLLLFLPAVLSYVVVRQGEHPLGNSFLSGLRKLNTTSALLPVAAATGVALSQQRDLGALPTAWNVLIIVSLVITAVLAVSSVVPFRPGPNYESSRERIPWLLRWLQGMD